MVIYLLDKMKQYEIQSEKLYDSKHAKERIKSTKIMRKWNKIRKIIEYQEGN